MRRFFIGALLSVALIAAGILVNTTASAEDGSEQLWVLGDGYERLGTLEKGSSHIGSIQLRNDDNIIRHIEMSTDPYSIDQEDGFSNDFETESDWTQLSKWISFPNGMRYSINPGEVITVDYRVDIPSNAIDGSQSAAISFGYVPREGVNSIGSESVSTIIESEFMWLLYADINGDSLVYNTKATNWNISCLFFDNKNVTATTTVENYGNISSSVEAHIEFSDFFGDTLRYEDNKEATVLPESKRAVIQKWDEAPQLGLFNVKEKITINEKVEVFEKTVLIFPLWLLLIIIVIIILLLIALILKIRKHSENKQNKKDKKTA